MKKLLVSFMMVFALVSCSTEELGNSGSNSSHKGVQLVLSTDGFNEVGSRAVDESVIHDVNILEYINGSLGPEIVYLKDADFSKAVEVTGLKDLDATKMIEETDGDGNKVSVMNEETNLNFIFVVANYGSQINREDVPNLAALKKFKMKFASNKDLKNVPMTGFYYGGINSTSTTQMSVTLQRAVAKINFTLDTSNFKVGGKTPSLLIVNSIKLCNVPGNVTLYPCKVRPNLPKNGVAGKWWNNDQTTLFPTTEEMEATGGSVTYGDDENQSSTVNTYSAYIPENARGSYDGITDNKDKHPSSCGVDNEDDDKCFTYILVDLDYALADGTTKKATYRIYLGGNSTGDMNLLRNTQYNVTTSLYGANDADTRIEVTDSSAIVVLDAANCYMIDMSDVTGDNKNIIIPLSQVNKGWEKIAGYDATQSTTKTQVAEMLKSGNWEIQTEWKTWQGSNITGTKVADLSDGNLKAVLTIPADIKNGNNAVVKLVSKADGYIYWSWHLWFTDYKPNKSTDAERKGQVHQYISTAFTGSNKYANKYMMDRNLGATITGLTGPINQPPTSKEAAKYYGLAYQWGRKDPFVGSFDGTGTKVPLYDAQDKPYTQGTTGVSSLATSFQKPGTFFVAPSSPNDWTSPQRLGLWAEDEDGKVVVKSPFDPCPAGWRVPTGGATAVNNPWAGFGNGTASSIASGNSYAKFTWQVTKTGQAGTAGRLYDNTTKAWYPASGYPDHSNGVLNSVGVVGYYWSATSTSDKSYSYGLGLSSGEVIPLRNFFRANGFPVRCIQE